MPTDTMLSNGPTQEKRNKKSNVGWISVPTILVLVISICAAILVVNHWALSRAKLKWWKTSVIYQVYPRSFKDSDGDGIGDLKGITSKLDYFNFLNVGAIWLNPVYESPMVDFGYDVSNFTKIDVIFGSMDDFDELIREAHSKGIRVIMDYIPNHTSDKHSWFERSRWSSHVSNIFRDHYVWHDGKRNENGERIPPNNWLSFFGGPAWTYNEKRQQYYLHQYTKKQPDLNWTNAVVRAEMKKCLKFWLDRGVDGFRVDSVFTLYEDEQFRDEPRSGDTDARPNDFNYLDHVYTQYDPRVDAIIGEWREIIDEYEKSDGRERFFVTEAYSKDINKIINYYNSGADMSFNFDLIPMDKSCNGYCMKSLVDNLLSHLPEGKWPNYVVGNHDNKRITSRYSDEYVDAINMMLLLLPGTPTVYYGDELGMEEIEVSYKDTQDPFGKLAGKERYKSVSRDPCRSPMQWSSDKQAGFSTNPNPWLPVHAGYETKNVQHQRRDMNSHLKKFVQLTKLRERDSFVFGETTFLLINESIFSFMRRYEQPYIVIINIGKSTVTADMTGSLERTQGMVLIAAGNSNKKPRMLVNMRAVRLEPGEGIVVGSE